MICSKHVFFKHKSLEMLHWIITPNYVQR